MQTFKTLAFAVSVFAVSMAASAQTAERYKSLSQELVAAGKVAMRANRQWEAQGLFERALVADPASVQALVGLGMAHEEQGRIGRGLKYYRQALEIDPNDLFALEIQTVAFLRRDMYDRAKENRDKLKRLCEKGCPALSSVEDAMGDYRSGRLKKYKNK